MCCYAVLAFDENEYPHRFEMVTQMIDIIKEKYIVSNEYIDLDTIKCVFNIIGIRGYYTTPSKRLYISNITDCFN